MDLPPSGRDPSPARARASSHLSQQHSPYAAQPQQQLQQPQNPADYSSLDPSLLQDPLFADGFNTDFSQSNTQFDLSQTDQFFDLNAASDAQFNSFLNEQSQEQGIPHNGQQNGQLQFPAFNDSSFNPTALLQQAHQHSSSGLLDPNNIPFDTHNHSPTPPHLLPSSTAISSRSTSPRATPSPRQSYTQTTRSRNTSESLDPSSAAFPHGHNFGADWAAGAAFRNHRRKPSDAHSEVSTHSAQASPFVGNLDFDQNVSPFLPAQSDAQFSNDAFGFTNFTLNDQSFGSNEHLSPVPSLQNSPRLPMDQQPLPVFSANDNFGLSPNLTYQQGGNAGFNTIPDMQLFDTSSFPNIDITGAESHEGHADTMSPPEINIQFAPPSRQPSFGPRNRASSTNELIPPDAMRRKRSKSDPFSGGNRPASPALSSRGRSPSLHTGTQAAATLSPAVVPVPGSQAPSPAGRNRSSSAASDSRQYLLDLADPDRVSGGPGEGKRQKHPSNYACHLCTKKFTRAYNLRSHLRTHTDERPFVCTICNKAFARQHDRKRHEGLHSGEKKFVCRGELKNGESWGCSRRFARADALGRHFRSEAGRECIKPLLEEETEERRAAWMEEQRQHQLRSQQGFVAPLPMTDMPQPGPQLPAVLLQMYPDLAGFNFGQALGGPLAEDPEDEYTGRGSFDASSGGEYMSDNDMYDQMQMDQQDASMLAAQPGNWP